MICPLQQKKIYSAYQHIEMRGFHETPQISHWSVSFEKVVCCVWYHANPSETTTSDAGPVNEQNDAMRSRIQEWQIVRADKVQSEVVDTVDTVGKEEDVAVLAALRMKQDDLWREDYRDHVAEKV